MPTYLVCVKKPAANPLLRGSATAYEHLDPVQIVTSNPALATPDGTIEYRKGLDDAMIRATGQHRHFVWVPLLEAGLQGLAVALIKTSDIVTPQGAPLQKRISQLDTAIFTAAERAGFDDRNADSVLPTARSLATALKLKV